MKKRNIITSILLLICIIFTGVGISPAHGTLADPPEILDTHQYETLDPHQYKAIEPHGGLVTVQLRRNNNTSLSFRVIHTSISGFNDSMIATIVPQRLENGVWVNRGPTITRMVHNAVQIDESGIIDVSAFGSGTYRIRVTITIAHNNGIISRMGPIDSLTVTL